MKLLRFLIECTKAYRASQGKSIVIASTTRYGVPDCVILVATGREAWRVSDFVTNYFANRGGLLWREQ